MLGAGNVGLIPDGKTRRAGSAKLDLGSRQTHAVDQDIPRTARRVDTAAYEFGENDHASRPRIVPDFARKPRHFRRLNRTWKWTSHHGREADCAIPIVG